jgi:exodeoxyribonuclease V alpha subunit
MSTLLHQLEREGALSAIDVELARTLCALASESSTEVCLAVALASREVQAGHVCADLTRLAGRSAFDARAHEQTPDVFLPELAPWLAALQSSALVSTHGLSDPARPLVLDEARRLYLARYYDHELRVAELLHALAATPAEAATRSAPEELVERLFPTVPGKRDRQREAALAARERRLSVIVGGPGTGKTSTVVKLLALLVSDALAEGRAAPRTLLVAPTGKAAQRLGETIERAREKLPVSDEVKRAIETRASTLHRALGPLEGSVTRFRHGRELPLECDLVLLDEASMVDLALMRRFLEAVPERARVIMLGDPDQLASVEAGGVLHDICRAAAHGDGPLARSVSELTESHRYGEGSGIASLARAVHAQAIDDVLAILRASLPDVTLHSPPKPRELGRTLERQAREHYAALKSSDVAVRVAALDHFRVLCAHRTGPASVEQLNPALARALGQRGARSGSYPGRPIIITENDYTTGLFNGDVGVIHADGARRRALTACFRVGESTLRRISIARLPSHESAYAMTVHKSQGSEFDHVAIVLPERPSPLLSRELLYTAITRARRSVTLYANEAALRACVLTRVERSSGLAERLTSRER